MTFGHDRSAVLPTAHGFVPPDPALAISTLARWVSLVADVAMSPHDVPTIDDWARMVGLSRRSLYRLCEIVGVSAKSSLNVGRLARTLVRTATPDWRPEQWLAADLRTVVGLLEHAGVRAYHHETAPTIGQFLAATSVPIPPTVRASLQARVLERITQA
jgi:hypothetical protein